MNHRELMDRLAAGIRRCGAKPTAWMETDGCYYGANLLGLPVYYCEGAKHHAAESVVSDCSLVPLWSNTSSDQAVDVKRFFDGFAEWSNDQR